MKKIIVLFLGAFFMFFVTGCESEVTNVDVVVPKVSTERMAEIETFYLESENVLEITNKEFEEEGTIVGTLLRGTFNEKDIITYIDDYGHFSYSVIETVRDSDGEIHLTLQGLDKESIASSNIIYKNQEYNGVSVAFHGSEEEIEKLEKILINRDSYSLEINEELVKADFVSYEIINNTLVLSLMLENDVFYEVGTNIDINGSDLIGAVEDHLR